MPKLFIIDEQWSPQPWYSTGGTRAKEYLQSPDNKFYYFKRSQYKEPTSTKPGKDFKYEFWSEIIAYEVGTLLGFNVLRYDMAVKNNIMGCISESMINAEQEELIEGVKYLQSHNPDYRPEDKDHRNLYTFKFIEDSLIAFELTRFLNDIVETIVFDSLIGNGDRHQENWAVINEYSLMSSTYKDIQEKAKSGEIKKWSWFKRKVSLIDKILNKDKSDLSQMGEMVKLFFHKPKNIAPIYDSGSSLGRELLDEKIIEYLQNETELERYINKGLAEIHWEGKKVNHFELIRNLMLHSYNDTIKTILLRVTEKFNGPEIERMVMEIDKDVPENLSHYKIPLPRKKLIIKMITLRFEKLRALIHEGV